MKFDLHSSWALAGARARIVLLLLEAWWYRLKNISLCDRYTSVRDIERPRALAGVSTPFLSESVVSHSTYL